jgi:hypothetical protein
LSPDGPKAEKEMRPPRESLTDFSGNNHANLKPSDPPAVRVVRPTGAVRAIEPLARWDGRAKGKAARTVWRLPVITQFHRSLATGAFAVLVLMLGSIILFQQYNGTIEPVVVSGDAATDTTLDTALTTADDIETSLVPEEVHAVRSRVFRQQTLIGFHRLQQRLPRPQFVATDFVPTKLIIYAENGLIKTRLEQQVTANYNKQPAIPN